MAQHRLRGATDRSAKVTLMEDGPCSVQRPTARLAAYYFPIASRLVGVEVYKGLRRCSSDRRPSAAINLLSRQVPERRPEVLLSANGNFGYAKVHLAAGGTRGRLGGLIDDPLASRRLPPDRRRTGTRHRRVRRLPKNEPDPSHAVAKSSQADGDAPHRAQARLRR